MLASWGGDRRDIENKEKEGFRCLSHGAALEKTSKEVKIWNSDACLAKRRLKRHRKKWKYGIPMLVSRSGA